MAEEQLRFDNLRIVLEEYGQAVQDYYKNRLSNDDKRATGDLINSVRYITSFGTNRFEISLNLMSYWKYVEYGRRAGKYPPPDKILEWIQVKRILPHPDDNGRLPTEKQLAYLIGRKISEEGIKAGNQLQETLQDVNNRYLQRIYDAIDKDLDGIAITILNNFTKSW